MLPLSDPKWRDLKANFTDGAHVASLLGMADRGERLRDWYDDLFQELCHQYTVSEVAVAAAPHLVRMAAAQPDVRKQLLVLLGACYAFSQSATRQSLPEQILEDWRSSATAGMPLIAGLLAESQESESDLRYLLCALAAVQGYPEQASAIEAPDA
jgi:hypothetical protein